MAQIRPHTLSGFMELLPEDQKKMQRVMATLRESYALYGFTPLDTPVIESADVLLAKGGGETEKQIYRFTKGDSDLALRFDLTVPLAKYVALHANEEMEKVRHALSLTGRDLTPTERKYIESWLSMGYGAEALAIAYDRTVVGTGKLAWAYMDKIVKSWYEKKLFTAEQIEKGDSRASSRAKPAAESAPRRTGGDDLARLEGILKNIGG